MKLNIQLSILIIVLVAILWTYVGAFTCFEVDSSDPDVSVFSLAGYIDSSCDTNDKCLGFTSYSHQSTANCPPTTVTLPSQANIKVYYTASGYLAPTSGSPTITGGSVGSGKLGSGRSGAQVSLDFGSAWTPVADISLSFHVKRSTGAFTDNNSVQVLKLFLTSNGGADFLRVDIRRNAGTPSSTQIVVTYSVGSDTATAVATFVANTDAALNAWNHVAVSTAAPSLNILVNGVSRAVSLTDNANVLAGTLNIAQNTHLLGNSNDQVDEMVLYSPALSESQQGYLYRLFEPNCGGWTQTYGAPKTLVNVGYSSGVFTIDLSFIKNHVNTVYHRLDTTTAQESTCITSGSDAVVSSAGQSWTSSETTCLKTFTLAQTLAQIYDSGAVNNNWEITLSADGKTIHHKLPIYSTYSVNKDSDCYTVTFKYNVQFDTYLTAFSTTDFTSLSRDASFSVSRLSIEMVDGVKSLVVTGKFRARVNNADYKSIVLTKGGVTFLPTAGADCISSGGAALCDVVFTKNVEQINSGSLDIGGDDYVITYNYHENKAVTATRTGETINFGIEYEVPQDPDVVSGDTITSTITLHNDNTFDDGDLKTTSYLTSDTVYIKNKIGATPAIPANYAFRGDEAYLCCVNAGDSFPSFNPVSNNGGCKTQTAGMTQHVALHSANSGVTYTPSSASGAGRLSFTYAVQLNQVLSGLPLSDAISCQILLLSKFVSTSRRSVLTVFSTADLQGTSASDAEYAEMRPSSLSFMDLTTTTPSSNIKSETGSKTTTVIAVAASAGAVAAVVGAVAVTASVIVGVIMFKNAALAAPKKLPTIGGNLGGHTVDIDIEAFNLRDEIALPPPSPTSF